MLKFGKILTALIAIVLFTIGIKYLYCSIVMGSNQSQVAGVFIALGASIFGIYLHFCNTAYRQSEKYLEFSFSQFKDIVKLISDNNDRIKWITASRILANIEQISLNISIKEHKELFEIQKLKYKTIIRDLLSDENKHGAFFYGSDDWEEEIDDSANKSTLTTKKQNEQGYTGGLNNLAEVSLYKLWSFTQFPTKYVDSLGNEIFTNKQISKNIRGDFPGLFEYLTHKRNNK